MTVRFHYYPGGKTKALTMSYDDGQWQDRRLVEMFNKYGIKGTFHLNSANFSKSYCVQKEEVATLYKGHEVSCHMKTHPWADRIPDIEVIHEILEDRKALEEACGYVVRGMSYPFGKFNPRSIKLLRDCGMEYSRTVIPAGDGFSMPEDFMLWHPTCHHKADIFQKLDKLLHDPWKPFALLYVWGHSFEFAKEEDWERIEQFCKEASEHADEIWFATNIEICDYVNALYQLRFSADRTVVYNPTVIDLWIAVDDKPVKIPAGETVKLA